jgi:glucose-6-phosphate isomerase
MPLTLDVTNCLSSRLGGQGLQPDRIRGEIAERFLAAHADVEARRQSGEMGFFALPQDREGLTRVQEVADSFGQWFETVVVLGIGGSSLGTLTLRDALLGPHWNLGDAERREHYPRLFVLENADPTSIVDLMGRIDLRRALFVVVSKSGSTAETMAQYLVVEGALAEAIGEEEARGHLLFITDPEAGVLRKLSRELGIPALPVPPNVGGRFSVLSAVGLLPAAVVGVDVEALLDGAGAMEERCRTPDLMRNPAGLFAALLHALHVEGGLPIHVMMPYADRLRSFSLWFQQLWAESLGKAVDRAGRTVNTGPTPLPALGATDQHSQVQLFMEGPLDKVVCFVSVADMGPDPVTIPLRHEAHPSLAYLGGHSIAELLNAERNATAEALRRRGRPSLEIGLPRLDARSLGELLMFLQIATVYAGALYGVDPLDQPGVELGKELTYGLLGREGFEPPVLDPGDPEWRI